MADHKRPKITLSMEDLEASLDSFLVEPRKAGTRGNVVAAEDTVALNCTNGATCNVKCGPTAYWECSTTPEWGCFETEGTCYPYCATQYAIGDPFC